MQNLQKHKKIFKKQEFKREEFTQTRMRRIYVIEELFK